MTAQELRDKFLKFFQSKGHTIIPSSSLVPENDPTVLFTTAGMHPLVPYLMGENHPGGKRVANVQKCVRTIDIDEVGDNCHLTFFEMLGNWSFGDYFKHEAIEWSFEFLTGKEWLGLDPKRIYATVFKGKHNVPRDEETIRIWQKIFSENNLSNGVAGADEMIKKDIRIIPLGADDNFWIAGATGPCGPDTEIFYDTRPEKGELKGTFSDLVNSGRIIEIWNDVFMEFEKKAGGSLKKLKQQNVDTGMGVERTLAVINGKKTVFETELFQPIFSKISALRQRLPKSIETSNASKSEKIIADHIKAATFMLADGVVPSNVQRGYVLRRLIRRAVRHGKLLGIENNFTKEVAEVVVEMYKDFYKELENNRDKIFEELEKEENKFRTGLAKLSKFLENAEGNFWYKKVGDQWMIANAYLPDDIADAMFDLYQKHGFPPESIFEELINKGINIDAEKQKKVEQKFNERLKKHQDLSRTASAGMFKGGLADASEITVKYHTATHLLLAALREILGPETCQKGSNITAERLRFDFNYPQKLTPEQIKQIEDLVNQKIQEKIPVEMQKMPKNEALKISKVSLDPSKYNDIVKVYKIGCFSMELCGGPHVKNTSELVHFKITKEEASSSGVRRIKAILG